MKKAQFPAGRVRSWKGRLRLNFLPSKDGLFDFRVPNAPKPFLNHCDQSNAFATFSPKVTRGCGRNMRNMRAISLFRITCKKRPPDQSHLPLPTWRTLQTFIRSCLSMLRPWIASKSSFWTKTSKWPRECALFSPCVTSEELAPSLSSLVVCNASFWRLMDESVLIDATRIDLRVAGPENCRFLPCHVDRKRLFCDIS